MKRIACPHRKEPHRATHLVVVTGLLGSGLASAAPAPAQTPGEALELRPARTIEERRAMPVPSRRTDDRGGDAMPLRLAIALSANSPPPSRSTTVVAAGEGGGRGPAPGPQSPVPFEQVQVPASRGLSGVSGAPAKEELPDLGAVGWRLAPIRWGGNAAAMLNYFKDGEGGQTLTQTDTINLRSASHIYQPWFAQVNANLGLVSGHTERSGPNIGADVDSRSTTATYGGSLNLFPLSRFPFQAYFDKGDSRASANTTGSDYTSTRLGARQSYRPEIGSETYAASYDRSVVASGLATSTVDAFQGNFAASLEQHAMNASARYSQSTAGLTGEASRLTGVTGSHTWRMDETLSVSSSANFSDQRIRYLSAGLLSTNDSRLAQATSNFTWLPDEDLPLTVTGGANLLGMETKTRTGANELTNLGGVLGATYRFTDRFTGTGNFQINETRSDRRRQLLLGTAGTLSYSGVPLNLGNYLYNWNVGGTAGTQSTSGSGGMTSVSGQFAHTLSRSVLFTTANVLGLTAGQSVSLGTNSQSGQVGTLVHSAGVSWRLGYEGKITGLFGATVNDNLTTGDYAGHYRTFNLNGNGLLQISRRASATANASLVWSGQRQEQQPLQLGNQLFNTDSSQWVGSASASYNHRNPFDVTNLVYSATVQYTSNQMNQRILGGDPNAPLSQVTRAFQQRLDYRVGRLTFQVLNSLASVNGKKNALIFFQVNRDLGGL